MTQKPFRSPFGISDDSLDDIRRTLSSFPRKSLREFSLQSILSRVTGHNATKTLKLDQYRVRTHEFKDSVKGKALFHLNGYVNSQNNRIRSFENPRKTILMFVSRNMACSTRLITDLIFFCETTTAECYQELIMNFISFLEVDEQDCCFQQDGATTHISNQTKQILSESIGGPVDSRIYHHRIYI